MFHSLLIILTPPHETPPRIRRGMDLLYEVYINEIIDETLNKFENAVNAVKK